MPSLTPAEGAAVLLRLLPPAAAMALLPLEAATTDDENCCDCDWVCVNDTFPLPLRLEATVRCETERLSMADVSAAEAAALCGSMTCCCE